jgi:hypothetical protein
MSYIGMSLRSADVLWIPGGDRQGAQTGTLNAKRLCLDVTSFSCLWIRVTMYGRDQQVHRLQLCSSLIRPATTLPRLRDNHWVAIQLLSGLTTKRSPGKLKTLTWTFSVPWNEGSREMSSNNEKLFLKRSRNWFSWFTALW